MNLLLDSAGEPLAEEPQGPALALEEAPDSLVLCPEVLEEKISPGEVESSLGIAFGRRARGAQHLPAGTGTVDEVLDLARVGLDQLLDELGATGRFRETMLCELQGKKGPELRRARRGHGDDRLEELLEVFAVGILRPAVPVTFQGGEHRALVDRQHEHAAGTAEVELDALEELDDDALLAAVEVVDEDDQPARAGAVAGSGQRAKQGRDGIVEQEVETLTIAQGGWLGNGILPGLTHGIEGALGDVNPMDGMERSSGVDDLAKQAQTGHCGPASVLGEALLEFDASCELRLDLKQERNQRIVRALVLPGREPDTEAAACLLLEVFRPV